MMVTVSLSPVHGCTMSCAVFPSLSLICKTSVDWNYEGVHVDGTRKRGGRPHWALSL